MVTVLMGIDTEIWVAMIAALGALFVSIANNVQNRRAKEPIEGTYRAVNSGRMERIEAAVLETQKAVARLEGSIDMLEKRTE